MRKTSNEELNRLSVSEFKQAGKAPLVIVLDNVRSLHNVGSVFRTADAFRVQALYLCGITGQPPDREIRKTALGATESVEWKYFASTNLAIEQLRLEGFRICSVEQAEQAVMLDKFHASAGEKLALVFGNEVKGVEQSIVDASDVVIEIPQQGTKHSLNIAVSVGVLVWDITCKQNAGKSQIQGL
ncbi:MAG TPA: RNA methyltransferase [Bacteroidia bacterium]|jgi:tRNA G18 (ribose-2'-O)-methylase SpoU|nr:RNA methyltransferase [Bacteroidia bacterium]